MSRSRVQLAVVLMLASLAVPAAGQAPPQGKKYALLVGVKTYEHDKLGDLKHTEHDVDELAAVLARSGFRVSLLTSTLGNTKVASKPTIKNIRAELKRILGEATKTDIVLVGLAGHGLQLKVKVGGNEKEESFFCPADARPRDTNDIAELSKTMISLSGLFKELDESGAGVKLLLVDACRNDPLLGRSVDVDSMPRPPRGTAALFSCKSGERSFETDKLGGGHGVFFYHVLQGLKGDAKNRKGEITWASLADHVTEKVSDQVPLLIGGGARQTPQEIRNLTGKSPVLADTPKVTLEAVPTTPAAVADAEAMFQKGRRAFEGSGGSKVNLREAAYWFEQAGDKGHVLAAAVLGTMYLNGIGIPQDTMKAKWLGDKTFPGVLEQARKGDVVAMNVLGFTYQYGLGVAPNARESVNWLRQAADKNYALAQANLGMAYLAGKGVNRDPSEAVKWLTLAARQKSAIGQYNLALIYGHGLGVRPNQALGAQLCLLAAQQGLAHAQYDVGGCYANGTGLPRNLDQARFWYLQAAIQGHLGAQQALRKMNIRRLG